MNEQISNKMMNVNKIYNNTHGSSTYKVAFSGLSESYCVGIVDMVNSTKISAGMSEREWCIYYEIFLNSMAEIIPRFGGVTIKNGGDNLLFYFPESSDNRQKFGFIGCLECSLKMIKEQKVISETLKKEGLPELNYRVSADYGKVVIMNCNDCSTDLIGPPVNTCAKINHLAKNNGVVIGEDLYQIVKKLNDYRFKKVGDFSIGLKFSYPIYSVVGKY